MDGLDGDMRSLLGDLLRIPSVSGTEGRLTRCLAERLAAAGLAVDLWQATEADVAGHAPGRHLPLDGRPTMVATLRGTGGGRSLLFNAHADTVGEGSGWTVPPYGGVERDGLFFGRGACDVKGPLVSAVWAMLSMRDQPPAGDVLLEVVPGEEDCVTLGTLTSVVRGHTAGGCVVLEPTEGLPRNASRPGLRFEITCFGRAVHGTVKWLGVDAIAAARRTCDRLDALQEQWNDRSAAAPLFAAYPFARPITVDTINGGHWQGMVCDNCRIGGYLELLPGDDPAHWRQRFTAAVTDGEERTTAEYPEYYPGHSCDTGISLCTIAVQAVEQGELGRNNEVVRWSGWSGFNSGCEAGLRANLLGTPTLVWGPGSLAQAHAADEFVAWADVRAVAGRFARFARAWSAGDDAQR